MKIPSPPRRRSSDIDMVPMINFAFLLLIFFLLVGRFGASEILHVDPPRAMAGAHRPGAEPALVLMDAEGRLAWGSKRVAEDGLRKLAMDWVQTHPDAVLPLKADRRVEAVKLIALLELLRDAGVARTELLTATQAADER